MEKRGSRGAHAAEAGTVRVSGRFLPTNLHQVCADDTQASDREVAIACRLSAERVAGAGWHYAYRGVPLLKVGKRKA
jgi:hypothetical protein